MKIEFELIIDDRFAALCRKVFQIKTIVFLVAAGFFTAGLFIFAGEFDVVHTFVPDEVIRSSEVNQNFRDLAERTLGTINDVNTEGADVDKVLKFNGVNWYAGNDEGGVAGDCEWDTVTGGINYAGGNVGIGTTGPGYKLHVADGYIYVDTTGVALRVPGTHESWDTIYRDVTHRIGIDTDYIRYEAPAHYYVGNVGIGITSPETLCHINSTINVDGLRISQSGNGVADFKIGLTNNDDALSRGTVKFQSSIDGGVLEDRMVINSAGNVGIGTTGPNARLHVYADSGILSRFLSDSADMTGVQIKTTATSGTGNLLDIRNGADANGTGGSGVFLIKNDGNVGIGTTDPNYTLDVNGDINCSGDFYNSGTPVADFVFDDNYTVLSIEEHARAMWENKHLPRVAGKDDLGDKPYSMSERREQILEELEIAHIYIEQLYNEMKDLKAEIAELKAE